MEIAFDERGLVPVIVQDWHSGEVLTLAYANAGGDPANARERRAAPLQPLAPRAMAQGRERAATHRPFARCVWTATATPCSRSSSRRAPPATPASARAFTTASSSRRRRTRRCRCSSARSPSAPPSDLRARTPSRCSKIRCSRERRCSRRPSSSRLCGRTAMKCCAWSGERRAGLTRCVGPGGGHGGCRRAQGR